jgi:drug/metabolite transporter (DMT)-like permease
LLVGTAALLWSTGGLLVRLIAADEPTLIFWRSAFGAAFLALFLSVRSLSGQGFAQHFTQLGWPGLLVAVMFALDTILFIFALERTSVANVVLIFSTTPFAAALLGWIWLHEAVTSRTWLAMMACTLGVAVMVSGSLGRSAFAGDLIALAVAVLFAIPVVIIRRHPEIRMLPAVLLSALVTAMVCAPFADVLGPAPRDYALMAVFGVVEFGLAAVAFVSGARHVPAAQTTLIGLLETVLAPIWVWVLVSETPAARTLVGGAVVLFSLLAYTLRDLREEARGRGG